MYYTVTIFEKIKKYHTNELCDILLCHVVLLLLLFDAMSVVLLLIFDSRP